MLHTTFRGRPVEIDEHEDKDDSEMIARCVLVFAFVRDFWPDAVFEPAGQWR